MSGNTSSRRRQRQQQQQRRVPLDVFLSGMLPPCGEKNQPVIVVDTSKKRSFLRGRVSDITYRSAMSNSNSSFCSSVTSPSASSYADATSTTHERTPLPSPALVASRWESIPSRRNQDTTLRVPSREPSGGELPKPPTRTRTNEWICNKKGSARCNVSPCPSKRPVLKKNTVLSPGTRLKNLKNGSKKQSHSFKAKCGAAIKEDRVTSMQVPPRLPSLDMSQISFRSERV